MSKTHLLFYKCGCGGWTRTIDLRVMSPASYQLLPPRDIYFVTFDLFIIQQVMLNVNTCKGLSPLQDYDPTDLYFLSPIFQNNKHGITKKIVKHGKNIYHLLSDLPIKYNNGYRFTKASGIT